jgi:hypothetical protein
MWLHRRRRVFLRNHCPPFSTAFVFVFVDI